MKTVPHNPNVKRKPILFHWHWLLGALTCGVTIDVVNHILGTY